jgi:hypothetical protein
MTTNWSQEKYDCSTWSEREAERQLHAQSESLVTKPTSLIEHTLTDGVETESRSTAEHAQWKMWFFRWDVILAALAGVMIFFILNVASIGVLGSALTVTGIVAAVGLGHYWLWGRAFARGVMRERQQVQERDHRSKTSGAEPPDEFPLELNDRERTELLQLLEHSLPAATEGRKGSRDSEAVRREFKERVRMFGA